MQDFASVLFDVTGDGPNDKSEAAVETRYDIAAGGHLTLIQVQHLKKDLRFYNNIGGKQETEGGFTLIQLVIGGGESYYGCFAGLQGHKSTFENRIAYLLSGTDKLDMNYDIDHTGSKSVSDVIVLIFVLAFLIPACASSSLTFCMMYSAYKLNTQGNNMQP